MRGKRWMDGGSDQSNTKFLEIVEIKDSCPIEIIQGSTCPIDLL